MLASMIRAAAPSDVPVLLALVRELAAYEKLEHQVEGREDDLHQHLFGDPRRAEALVAEDAGEVVGFALFFHNYSTFLTRPGIYLEDLFVRPAHRRKGYGKDLLRALARLAVERGCGRFEWSVLDWNAPAIAFYESLGATAMADWTTFRVTGEALARLAAGEVAPAPRRFS
jgi:GNAT superfamily N-acetyltransferase